MIGVNQRERCIGIKLYFERDSHLSSKPTIRRLIPQRDWSFWWVIGDTKARQSALSTVFFVLDHHTRITSPVHTLLFFFFVVNPTSTCREQVHGLPRNRVARFASFFPRLVASTISSLFLLKFSRYRFRFLSLLPTLSTSLCSQISSRSYEQPSKDIEITEEKRKSRSRFYSRTLVRSWFESKNRKRQLLQQNASLLERGRRRTNSPRAFEPLSSHARTMESQLACLQ